MNGYLWLLVAIVSEVIGTTALAYSEQFTRWLPSIVVVVGYCLAFYCLGHSLKTLNVGIAYAIWCGMGVVLVAAIQVWVMKQPLDGPAWLGMALIVSGVLVMNLFSKSVQHT